MPDLKGGQIIEGLNALAAFDAEYDWSSPKLALAIGRIMRKLKYEAELLDEERKKAEREHLRTDVEGNPILVEGVVQYDDRFSFEDKLKEIQEDVVTVEFKPITLETLEAALPKKDTLKFKGRWAGVFDECGIIEFPEDSEE